MCAEAILSALSLCNALVATSKAVCCNDANLAIWRCGLATIVVAMSMCGAHQAFHIFWFVIRLIFNILQIIMVEDGNLLHSAT